MNPRIKKTLRHPIFIFTLGLCIGFLASELKSLVKILADSNHFQVSMGQQEDPFAEQQRRMRKLMEDQMKMFGGSLLDEEDDEPGAGGFTFRDQDIQTESLEDKVIFRIKIQDPKHHKVTVKAENGMLHVTMSYETSDQGSGGGFGQFQSQKMVSLEPGLDATQMKTELQGDTMVITIPRRK